MDLDDDELRATRILNGLELLVEENTEEELEKYEAYKKARNERVKEKFGGER